MKKLLTFLGILAAFLLPLSAFAITDVWTATSTDKGYIAPNTINGNNPYVSADHYISTSTSATSTFAYGVNVTAGCIALSNTCLTSNLGTLTSLTASSPLTGGTITSSGSIGIQAASASQNGYLSLSDYSLLHAATTTFTSPLIYTNSTNAVTCQTASGSQAGCLASADWTTFNNKQTAGNYITALTGDVTASGPGSVASTLATVNGNVGSFGGVSSIPSFTVNAKGLITAASANTPSIPVGDITGVLPVANGGTASSTLGGIITGAGTSAVTSATIGSGISFSGNTLSNSGVTSIVAGTNVTISGSTGAVTINATGGGGGSGTVGTSTVPTVGNLSYWTSNGFPSLLGTVATTTVSCSGSSSCTPFVAIGGSPITISSSGGSGSIYPFTPSTFGATNTSATSTNINDTAGFSSTASSTLFSLTTLNSTSTNATTTAFAQIGLNATSTFASGIIAPCFATSTAGNCITPSQLVSETPTGTINGSNTAFTVVHTPTFLILNGAVYTQGVDYTLSGLSVTMTIAPVTGSVFRSYYGSVLGGSGGGGTSIIRNVIATSSSGIMASLANNDYTYLASSTSPLTLTLPAAAGNSNIYVVKDNGTTTVTVASASAIDNASTTVLGSIYQAVTLQSDGTNWWIQ